jgi:uncharacterized protein YwgA
MTKWGASINHDYGHTGEFYIALIGPYSGKVGEKVLTLSWGGIILEFENGQKITFSLSDVQVVDNK